MALSPLLQLLKAVRGTGLKPPLRRPILKTMRSAGKGSSKRKGNPLMTEFHESELDELLALAGENRFENPYFDDVLDIITEMYERGGMRL